MNPYTFGAAMVVLAYLLWVTFKRARGSEADPTVDAAKTSETGAFTFLISGTYLVAAGAAFIAWMTWPLVKVEPAAAGGLALLVIGHYLIEKEERQ